MEKKKDFERLYSDICSNSNQINVSLNEAKKEKRKLNKIKLIICLIVDTILYFLLINFLSITFSIYSLFPVIMLIVIFDFIICKGIGSIFGKKQKEYNSKFKEIVIKKIMDNFYENLEYFPNKQLPEAVYKEAKYNEYYTNYDSEDYLEAKINNEYDIDLAEVITTSEEEYTDSEGNEHTNEVTVFNGLFTKIVIDKSINSKIEIVQNGQVLFNKKRLKMDFNEFEKYFDVVSQNKILGMQILTPDVMLELLEFLNNYNTKFDIVINNNVIYIRFHCGPMFESAKLEKGAFDRVVLKEYYDMLKLTYDLSCKLISTIKELEI